MLAKVFLFGEIFRIFCSRKEEQSEREAERAPGEPLYGLRRVGNMGRQWKSVNTAWLVKKWAAEAAQLALANCARPLFEPCGPLVKLRQPAGYKAPEESGRASCALIKLH